MASKLLLYALLAPLILVAVVLIAIVQAVEYVITAIARAIETHRREMQRLADDCDLQHRMVLADDPRGTYGWPR